MGDGLIERNFVVEKNTGMTSYGSANAVAFAAISQYCGLWYYGC